MLFDVYTLFFIHQHFLYSKNCAGVPQPPQHLTSLEEHILNAGKTKTMALLHALVSRRPKPPTIPAPRHVSASLLPPQAGLLALARFHVQGLRSLHEIEEGAVRMQGAALAGTRRLACWRSRAALLLAPREPCRPDRVSQSHESISIISLFSSHLIGATLRTCDGRRALRGGRDD